jgi:hypothetical protein
MARGHLDDAGAEFPFDEGIEDHGDLPIHQRQHDSLAPEPAIALIVGMDGHGGVAEHRLGTGRRHHHELGRILDRVADVPELALGRLIFDFQVRNRRDAARAPVDQVLALVDQPVLPQAHEDLTNGARQSFIHREPLPAPVAGAAQLLDLSEDSGLVLFLPAPDDRLELLTGEIGSLLAFRRQILLDDILGGDAGVIGAGDPQYVVPVHALPAGQNVLQRDVERVTHVQGARHVGRRQHHREGREWRIDVGVEEALLFPPLVERLLRPARFVAFRNVGTQRSLLFPARENVNYSLDTEGERNSPG